jgi:soluble lytic murein transglycosylase-like protein
LRSVGAAGVLGVTLLFGTVYAHAPADATAAASSASQVAVSAGIDASSGVVASASAGRSVESAAAEVRASRIAELEERVSRVNGAWAALSEYYESKIAPLERVLLRYSSDSALVSRISVALVREAKAAGIEPRLLLAVLLVENPWLDPDIRSPVGAIGLMQVMPLHRGGWPECGTDLEDVEANICHGARIFAHYYQRSDRNLDRALLRYNGCVNGTNTPDCHQYPNHVFAHAGRASVLGWLDRRPTDGS